MRGSDEAADDEGAAVAKVRACSCAQERKDSRADIADGVDDGGRVLVAVGDSEPQVSACT